MWSKLARGAHRVEHASVRRHWNVVSSESTPLPFGLLSYRRRLHLASDLFTERLEFVLVHFLHRPLHAQSLGLVRLGNDMEVYVVYSLVGQLAIVLQEIPVGDAEGFCDVLRHGLETVSVYEGEI